MPKGKPEDLTGQRFGAWLVLGRAPSIGRAVRYFCRCDCGHERPVQANNLKAGRSTRCPGCANRARAANRPKIPKPPAPPKVPKPKGRTPVDMTGWVFGEWTVLYFVGVTPARQRLWKCQCSCGNKAVVQGGNLRSGRSTRCLACGGRRGAEAFWRARRT